MQKCFDVTVDHAQTTPTTQFGCIPGENTGLTTHLKPVGSPFRVRFSMHPTKLSICNKWQSSIDTGIYLAMPISIIRHCINVRIVWTHNYRIGGNFHM